MQERSSYRSSHVDVGHGSIYDRHLQEPWQSFIWSREQVVLEKVLATNLNNRDIDLLDFACGTGRVAHFLEDRVRSSTGVDISGSMLGVAASRLKHTMLIEADITRELPNQLRERAFNLVTAFRFFLNAEPLLRAEALEALVPLLSPDGYLVLNNHGNADAPYVKLLRRHARRKGAVYNPMSLQDLRGLINSAGLEIVELWPVGFLHLPRPFVRRALCEFVDQAASRWQLLDPWFEDQVAVCRRIQ